MNKQATLDCRIIMDPAAFARFCETRSIAWCAAGPHKWPGRIAVDANGDSIMLEAAGDDMRNLRLLPDLHTAAKAGQVDGAVMIAHSQPRSRLEAVVFRNGETWTGGGECMRSAVHIGPDIRRRVEYPGGHLWRGFFVDGSSDFTCRVRFEDASCVSCYCGEGCQEIERLSAELGIDSDFYDEDSDDDVPVVDITTFMPARATGQVEQALAAAAAVVSSEGRLAIERLVTDGRLAVGSHAWNGAGWVSDPGMFRRWLETFSEATGERYVTWVPHLFDVDPAQAIELDGTLNYRPVCADTGASKRGPCPVFLVSDSATSDTIRVPAHVDNASLANAAKLAAGGADPAEAVAIFAAITDPDRR